MRREHGLGYLHNADKGSGMTEEHKKTKIDQALENAMAIIGALALGVIAGWIIAQTYSKPAWQEKARAEAVSAFQKKAVKDRAGAWTSDPEGAPQFRWASCNQFGIKE